MKRHKNIMVHKDIPLLCKDKTVLCINITMLLKDIINSCIERAWHKPYSANGTNGNCCNKKMGYFKGIYSNQKQIKRVCRKTYLRKLEIKMFVMLNHRNSMYLPKQNEVIVQNVKNILKSDNLSPSYNSGMTKENLKKKNQMGTSFYQFPQ